MNNRSVRKIESAIAFLIGLRRTLPLTIRHRIQPGYQSALSMGAQNPGLLWRD
ncbi:hypothetical protein [Allocoleopsis sp.]|uniref:hypothetical protein n=1 Tax=Allocoleopsis sp. TaxID=3088169 RepID=UPI002FD3909B